MKIRKAGFFFILVFGTALFYGYFLLSDAGPAPLLEAFALRGQMETGAENLVAAIYLNYRLFDTLLEALLLLVSVIGVSQFAKLSGSERMYQQTSQSPEQLKQNKSSHILEVSLTPVYFLIAIFGVYVIVTGMDGPGGGFQGGAILAAILISVHFAQGKQLLRFGTAEKIEKLMYVLILATGMFFLTFQNNLDLGQHRIYLLLMNVLIGVKVFTGLSMIYLRFMSGEPEDKL